MKKDGSDHHPDPFIRGAEIILLVQVADKGNQVFIADAAVADTIFNPDQRFTGVKIDLLNGTADRTFIFLKMQGCFA